MGKFAALPLDSTAERLYRTNTLRTAQSFSHRRGTSSRLLSPALSAERVLPGKFDDNFKYLRMYRLHGARPSLRSKNELPLWTTISLPPGE